MKRYSITCHNPQPSIFKPFRIDANDKEDARKKAILFLKENYKEYEKELEKGMEVYEHCIDWREVYSTKKIIHSFEEIIEEICEQDEYTLLFNFYKSIEKNFDNYKNVIEIKKLKKEMKKFIKSIDKQ